MVLKKSTSSGKIIYQNLHKEDILMEKYTKEIDFMKEKSTGFSCLEDLAREGARLMLQYALNEEVNNFIGKHQTNTYKNGKRKVVRNGSHPKREIITGIGPIEIKQPRVDDRSISEEERFTSNILPRYLRRFPSIDNLVPTLYLKGISTNDFTTALTSILGEGVKGLSATNIVRLKQIWEKEYQQWTKRDLSKKEYVYFWVDGIYCNVRLDGQRSCLLIIMGADEHGKKELIGVNDGYRESKTSWKEILLDLKQRGLKEGPKLAVGDGALGFWAALDEEFPKTKWQRCWVHKTGNILDKMPKAIQSKAKSMIHDMYMADTEENAWKAYNHFLNAYEAKYPKAVECLKKDKEDLFTFYKFPAVHWIHIRTTNPIESTFATVRNRTRRTKGCGSRLATLTMVYKLCLEAEKTWHKLKGYTIIPLVLKDKKFRDGELVEEDIA
jgi:transposase-like protein